MNDKPSTQVDENFGVATIPRDLLVFPEICTICLESTQDRMEISGGKSVALDVALAMVSANYCIEFEVPVCQHCKAQEKKRTALIAAIAIIGFIVGALMVMLPKFEDGFIKLGGMVFLISSPIIGWIFASKAKQRPVIKTFTRKTVTVQFPNPAYMPKYLEFLKDKRLAFESKS